MDDQHIYRLTIRRFMGAEDIDIYGAEVNELAGECESGKTSTLRAIEAAFVGAKAVPERPVTLDSGEKGTVKVETDDLEFVLVVSADRGVKWVCRRKDGSKLKHGDIDAITSRLWFDPTTWAYKHPDQMRADLLELAGKPWVAKYHELRREREKAEEQRLISGREVRALGALPEEPPRVEPVDVSDLAVRLEAMQEWNDEQDVRRQACEQVSARILEADDERRELDRQYQEDVRRINEKRARAVSERERILEPEPRQDTAPLLAELKRADAQNAAAQAHANWERLRKDLDEKEEVHRRAELAVDDVKLRQGQHTAALKLPVEGLVIEPSGAVTFKGLPFPEQINTGELILISAELAMAQNATIKVMCMQHGEALDKKTFARLVELGRKKKVQTWLATTGEGHGAAIHLAEGRVVADKRR